MAKPKEPKIVQLCQITSKRFAAIIKEKELVEDLPGMNPRQVLNVIWLIENYTKIVSVDCLKLTDDGVLSTCVMGLAQPHYDLNPIDKRLVANSKEWDRVAGAIVAIVKVHGTDAKRVERQNEQAQAEADVSPSESEPPPIDPDPDDPDVVDADPEEPLGFGD